MHAGHDAMQPRPSMGVAFFCSYYSLADTSHESINKYLSNLVEQSLRDLEISHCIEIKEVCVIGCILLQLCCQ